MGAPLSEDPSWALRIVRKNTINFCILENHHPPSPGPEEVNGLFQTFTSQATGHRGDYHRNGGRFPGDFELEMKVLGAVPRCL